MSKQYQGSPTKKCDLDAERERGLYKSPPCSGIAVTSFLSNGGVERSATVYIYIYIY